MAFKGRIQLQNIQVGSVSDFSGQNPDSTISARIRNSRYNYRADGQEQPLRDEGVEVLVEEQGQRRQESRIPAHILPYIE